MVYPDAPPGELADPDTCTDCMVMDYDEGGRLVSRTDQRAITTTYGYDDRGLLLSRMANGNTDTFDYDALGRRKRPAGPSAFWRG